MTDFSTKILPEEEEKVEELLPKREDTREIQQAIKTSAEPEESLDPTFTQAGNAVLAQQLGHSKHRKSTTKSTQKVETKKPRPSKISNEKQPKMAAKPRSIPEKHPEPEPMLKAETGQPKADPIAERQERSRLLSQALSQLMKTPENAAIDVLFTAFLKAPMDEQATAALIIANAVLRIDADTRRRTRIVLAQAMTMHKSHPLVQILAIRFGAWVSIQPTSSPDSDSGSRP